MVEQDNHFTVKVSAQIEKDDEGLYESTVVAQGFTGDEDGSDDAVILQRFEKYFDKEKNDWVPVQVVTDEHPEGKEEVEEIFIPVRMIDDVISALKVMKERF